MLKELEREMLTLADKDRAKNLSWYFKTGKGQYGEGDKFLGLNVPQQRSLVKKYTLTLPEIKTLLVSPWHEHRLTALLSLVKNYNQTKITTEKREIVHFYLKNAKKINNWDLVDLSAPNILGDYLLSNDRTVLYKLANSKNLWEKRISILATFSFIRNKDYTDTLKIAEILINDTHDLIHKAVGWMLREVGKKNQPVEEKFLDKYYTTMPRTMLRYSIEKFSDIKRKHYMAKDR